MYFLCLTYITYFMLLFGSVLFFIHAFVFCYIFYVFVFIFFFFSSRRRHTRCALVTGVQTCALPIFYMIRMPDANGFLTLGIVQENERLQERLEEETTLCQEYASEMADWVEMTNSLGTEVQRLREENEKL